MNNCKYITLIYIDLLLQNPVAHCWSEPFHHKRKFCNVCRKRLDDSISIHCESEFILSLIIRKTNIACFYLQFVSTLCMWNVRISPWQIARKTRHTCRVNSCLTCTTNITGEKVTCQVTPSVLCARRPAGHRNACLVIVVNGVGWR